MKKHKRIEIGVVLTFLLWTVGAAGSLRISHHPPLPIGRSLLAGGLVGLMVVGLLTLVVAIRSLIFPKERDPDPLRSGEEAPRITAVRFR
jgi:hypothetical protein